jgi:thiol-disulfide isomerase/thioredoxin
MTVVTSTRWLSVWLLGLAGLVSLSPVADAKTRVAVADSTPPAKMVTAKEFKQIIANSKGDILIVNVWATWCVPCLREIPDLLTLEAEFKAHGVQLLGVAVDDPSPQASEVERFRTRYFPKFLTYARSGLDLDELTRVIDPTWNEVVPTTYILDREGAIKHRIQGKQSLEQFRAVLQTLL